MHKVSADNFVSSPSFEELARVESTLKSSPILSQHTEIDGANIGRRTFKKQNRSTVVESSNSFSKSRKQNVGLSLGNISQEKAQTFQTLGKDENSDFNTIKEEEEIPFNSKTSQNISPITPHQF